jgi:hypothetical protein
MSKAGDLQTRKKCPKRDGTLAQVSRAASQEISHLALDTNPASLQDLPDSFCRDPEPLSDFPSVMVFRKWTMLDSAGNDPLCAG